MKATYDPDPRRTGELTYMENHYGDFAPSPPRGRFFLTELTNSAVPIRLERRVGGNHGT